MFKRTKSFIAGFLSCLLLFGTFATVLAADDINISAILSNTIKMKLFGKDFNPTEADGTYVKPIVYNSRTYLPARNLADALGIPIEWDGNANTVWIGGKTDSVPVNDASMYHNDNGTILTTDIDKLTTSDTTYKWGITNKEVVTGLFYKCYVKPNGKYKRFTASLFLDEHAQGSVVVEFKKETWDGSVIKSVTLEPGQTTNIDIDIGGVNNLYIYSSVVNVGTLRQLIIGEPTFKNTSSSTNITN
ncbi:stalk domain-containing protein [Petroclostridium sp. X23]|uniref:stalk domain-containing protein n=1 Tax=Petroclostridium sp. X23 TaxID=3045146 RepID=UPI0024ADB56B|nr:stalk domain-containing protein [Petroclostridium sp. X23]WHH56927.1 stalk domain-containing protein [Petroclostridium sp. X23]